MKRGPLFIHFQWLRLKKFGRTSRFDRVSNARDLWYGGSGAFQQTTFGYAGRPSNGNRGLGWLYDVGADSTEKPKTTITAYLDFARGNRVQSAVYPLGGNN